VAARFLREYRSQLQLFESEYEVAPGVVVSRTGGHTPGHSIVRLASGSDRLTFAVALPHPTAPRARERFVRRALPCTKMAWKGETA
jgi:hypothetical protein